MTQFWRNKIVLAEIETTYGVDPTPTGADAILAKNVRLTPMQGNDVDRELDLPHFGNQGTIASELHQKLTFQTEVAGSGAAGTAPPWGKLMRMCGAAEVVTPGTSVVYNPISDAIESGTLYIWIDSTRYAIPGGRATVKLTYTAQNIPMFEWDFTGLYQVPSETARVQPDLSNWQKPLIVSNANTPVFTIGGSDFVLREAMLDLRNQIEPRFLVGSEGILLTDREDLFTARVEAVPVSTFNPYDLARASAEVAIALTHGTQAGNIVTLDIPKAQMQRPEGLENAQDIVEWPLRFAPIPTGAGNDQWTLTVT